ncbi:hypothetical protein PIB30_076036 [Stylosanthes scabra]|uniref:Secreted protein n=1 Tax=Stylosanthes scabra TaxID=79078 RepID=A0ABU6QQ81_9FABA|nr:hypothetical protein [Stylosanthes scabra]
MQRAHPLFTSIFSFLQALCDSTSIVHSSKLSTVKVSSLTLPPHLLLLFLYCVCPHSLFFFLFLLGSHLAAATHTHTHTGTCRRPSRQNLLLSSPFNLSPSFIVSSGDKATFS